MYMYTGVFILYIVLLVHIHVCTIELFLFDYKVNASNQFLSKETLRFCTNIKLMCYFYFTCTYIRVQ